MQVKIFSISIFDDGRQTEELNKFLRSHAIIDTEKQLITTLPNPVWTFMIRYKENSQRSFSKGARIDYRDVLDDATFNIFSKLRSCRKKIAEKSGVPVFAIFTNEELAKIAKLEELNEENIMKIEGVGAKRIEKYGKPILEMYKVETK